MYFKQEVFLIVGIAKSGVSCGKFLLSKGAKCYFYDSNLKSEEVYLEITKLGGEIIKEEQLDDVLSKITILVLSPGVPIDSSIPKRARALGKRITGEMEIGAEYLKNPILAVTGTNGKTTTVYMLEHILNLANIKAKAVGNVGLPLTELCSKEESLAVTEVSSFQMETCNRIMPHIAVVLNITPDHLSRHYTMDNYVFLKSKLLRNMRESEFAVLNYDDAIVKGFSEKTRAKILYFSIKEEVLGAYLKEGRLYFNKEEIIKEEELFLKGKHNIQNALACIVCCKILGVDNAYIKEGLSTFKGARHRIELVKEIDGVEYYNDSKSTNPDSTIKAVEAMQRPCVLLLGGKDKGLDYTEMMKIINDSKVESVCLYGETRFKMLDSAKKVGIANINLTQDMDCAVKLARHIARKGWSILLSPACSSFDRFSGYEERGEKYIETVNSLI